MRLDPPCLPAYAALAELIRDEDWFILSTNADAQAGKMGLDPSRIFTPQGDYSLFQCSLPCREEVWDNRRQVLDMIERMPDPLHIREEDIPRCPHCGRVAVPNLRKDDTFVDALYHEGYPRYRAFLERALESPGELCCWNSASVSILPELYVCPSSSLRNGPVRVLSVESHGSGYSRKAGRTGHGIRRGCGRRAARSMETSIQGRRFFSREPVKESSERPGTERYVCRAGV